MRSVCVYIGSRANYSSAKPIMQAIQRRSDLRLQVVLGGAAVLDKYGNIEHIIAEDGFEVDGRFHMILEGQTPVTMAKSTGVGIIELAHIFDNLKPDLALIVGDRFDVMAPAIAASYMNIPIVHTMGGEVTGTIDEFIRHAVTKMSTLHCAANEDARQRIIRLGEDPGRVYNVGCPRIDLVREVAEKHKNGDGMENEHFFQTFKGVGGRFNLTKDPFLLVSQHPVTTEYGSNRSHMENTLEALGRLALPTVMIWPNVDAGSDEISKAIRTFREDHHPAWLHLFINLPVEVYIQLMNICACMVGNSSSAIREGAFLGTPAVNVGSRQDGRVRGGNVIDTDNQADAIEEAIRTQLEIGRRPGETIYGDGHTGDKIATVIAEYQDVSRQKHIYY